ncbi:MAG: formylmethanofuran--tetrahydromethanopterin N-formyltransferase [Pseudomonadota bacterium]
MKIKSTEIDKTFAEAFSLWGARIIITAETIDWAKTAAGSMTGFATSIIGCGCEAGIESELTKTKTPDKRPGVSVLLFTLDKKSIQKRLVERIGQCVMTCPTTSCYNGLGNSDEKVNVGGQLRYFGDSFQISKKLNGQRFWRIPVMDGEFVIEEEFKIQKSVGGGNIFLLGENPDVTLQAAQDAARSMRKITGVILPFPDGVVRSGSKVGSKYKALPASTNHAYCPTLKGVVEDSSLDDDVNCVLEIVVDGLDEKAVKNAMRAGIKAAARKGIKKITAGNYGGKLGQHKINLHDILK